MARISKMNLKAMNEENINTILFYENRVDSIKESYAMKNNAIVKQIKALQEKEEKEHVTCTFAIDTLFNEIETNDKKCEKALAGVEKIRRDVWFMFGDKKDPLYKSMVYGVECGDWTTFDNHVFEQFEILGAGNLYDDKGNKSKRALSMIDDFAHTITTTRKASRGVDAGNLVPVSASTFAKNYLYALKKVLLANGWIEVEGEYRIKRCGTK